MKDLNLDIFPKINKGQWKKLAEKQLKGGDPDEQLIWENNAGINLEAYYDQTDLSGLHYLTDFFSGLKPHRWKLYEEVKVAEDIKKTNEQILNALMGGCDGVILSIEDADLIEGALKEVDETICDVSIRSERKINAKGLSGMMIMPEGNCQLIKEADDPVKQLLEILDSERAEYIFRNAFPDFFLEIATVRALRFLVNDQGNKNTHIHTHIPRHQSDEHQWFLNTTAGLASILGGSHSVDFTTAIGDPRISRNTGNLIREESGIEEYSDQCGGSFYIEVLTDKIINGVKEKLK
ncbi:methylmalonyl-CoA mutase family protein [Ekhidna sp.]|uniref:methylmalonyl-CoA mutase family protein n=1 Tax=Ekhidna sp. TaxID=2608089 RepID=UPI003B591B7D